MQEVPLLDQPLFARLVIRPIAINLIDIILEGLGKVKFSINGKHVWARRYIRKSTKSPQKTPPIIDPSNVASSSGGGASSSKNI